MRQRPKIYGRTFGKKLDSLTFLMTTSFRFSIFFKIYYVIQIEVYIYYHIKNNLYKDSIKVQYF